ncbi:type IV secretory system conjugative DNA transfer family protein [Devosia sp. LjRoot3]
MNENQPDLRARLPISIRNPGLLVGWSLEREHAKQPIGFSFGNPMQTPAQGFLDPILFEDEGHLITIAPTGAGKGVGCIIPALLRHDGPMIVIDPKGENYAITARFRRQIGQQVYVLDPMGTTNAPPKERANLNPLDAIDIEDGMAVDEISATMSTLAARLRSDRDQFWVGRATHLLIGIVAHVLADLPPAERHLGKVRDLLLMCSSAPEVMIERLNRSRHPVANQTLTLLGVKAPETLGGIQSFAQDMMGFIRGPMVEEAIASTSFDLAEVTAGGADDHLYCPAPTYVGLAWAIATTLDQRIAVGHCSAAHQTADGDALYPRRGRPVGAPDAVAAGRHAIARLWPQDLELLAGCQPDKAQLPRRLGGNDQQLPRGAVLWG